MTQAFNLSQLANNVNTSGQLNAAAGLYNQVPVANGGTGVATVATGNILVGAGTSAMTALAGTNTNDVVTWNGTTWTSAISAGGPAPVVRIYTSPSPWTKPASLKGVKVTMLSGGGSGAAGSGPTPANLIATGGGGGAGGFGNFPAPTITGPLTVTVGAGGAAVTRNTNGISAGNSGGSSSFGALFTITGGGGGPASPSPTGGATGSITPSPTIFGYIGTNGGGSTVQNVAGDGGNAFQLWGFGALGKPDPGAPTPIVATPASGYGAGGGGAIASSSTRSCTSGAGSTGFVIVEEFY